ncbi:MAG: DUF4129 domain-containing transglutaminase family protein [Armatimonadota bacterium]
MNTQVNKYYYQQLSVLYISAFGACAAGLVTLDAYTDDAAFTITSLFLLGLGFYSSWAVKAEPKDTSRLPRIIRYLIVTVLSIIFIMHLFSNQLISFGSAEAGSQNLAIFITIIMIAISFYTAKNEMLLFTCVPPLSLIGLTGTMGLDEGILLYFGVYLTFACLMIMQINIQSNQQNRLNQTAPFGIHAGIAALITLGAIITGMILGRFIYEPMDKKILSHLVNPLSIPSANVHDINDYVPVGPSPASSSEELFTVKCAESLLWRGQTFNWYNGRVWRDNRPFSGIIIKEYPKSIDIDPDFGWPAQSIFDIPDIEPNKIQGSVKPVEQLFESNNWYDRIIFSASEPKRISFSSEQHLFVSTKAIATSKFRTKGSKYRVISLVSTATPNQLKRAGTDYPSNIKEWYLETPPFEFDIKELSSQICAGKRNPYDKARAIQDYLEKNYTYDLMVSLPRTDDDMISVFLFKTKRGHCTLFATAMAMLCRHEGIPSRLATGYTTGEFDAKDGRYHIDAGDKHAWTELYFPGYGWITFDPSAANVNISLKERLIKALTRTSQYITSNRNTIIIIAIVILLAAYLVKTELLDKYKLKGKSAIDSESASLAVKNYRKMCKIMARFGYAKDPTMTPLEYASAMSALFTPNLILLSSMINKITTDFIDSGYAGLDIPAYRLNSASAAITQLNQNLRTARRKKLLPAYKVNKQW